MHRIVSYLNDYTLIEVNEMCKNWKESFTQKEAYNSYNEEIVRRLKEEKFDVNTIWMILKAFLLAQEELEHVEQSANLSYLLRKNEKIALRDNAINISALCTLYPKMIKEIDDINKQVKAVLPDTEKAYSILHSHKNSKTLYDEAKLYDEVMGEILDIHVEYDISILNIKNLPSLAVYPLLDVDANIGDFYLHDYILFFYDYLNLCLDILEEFIKYFEKIVPITVTTEAEEAVWNVGTKMEQENKFPGSSIDPNLYEDPKIVKLLLDNTLLKLKDLLEEGDYDSVEWYQRDQVAKMAIAIVEERFHNGLFDKDSLDLAEKALLLAFQEELVIKALVYISMIINQIEGLDFEDDILQLSLINSELSNSIQELFTFDTLFDASTNISDFMIEALIAIHDGKDIIQSKVSAFVSLIQELIDKYNDYTVELEEDYVYSLMKEFNIESEDPLNDVASVFEYYDDYDYKLFKLNMKLD